MNVKDKIVVLTGGAGGLGSVMAECLCREGAKVCLLDIDEDKGNDVVKDLTAKGGEASFYRIDLTSEQAWSEVIKKITDRYGRIDVLINNAGINIRKSIEEKACRSMVE